MPEHDDTAINIADMLDQLYMASREQFAICLGIWDAGVTPFTYYATLCNSDGVALLGESSYGSDTLAEAVANLYEEVCRADLNKLT